MNRETVIQDVTYDNKTGIGYQRIKGSSAVMVCLVAAALLYQNFSNPQLSSDDVKPIDQTVREAHARELLGKYYEGSIVQNVGAYKNLHRDLFAEVQDRLPEKFKVTSFSVTQTIVQVAAKYEFDPFFLVAVIQTESRFEPLAKGNHGEIGLMQIKPKTAEWIAKKYNLKYKGPKTLRDPAENIRLGAAYFNYLRTKFSAFPSKYVSAYNMGASKVRRMYAEERKPKDYPIRVMRNYQDTYLGIQTTRQPRTAAN